MLNRLFVTALRTHQQIYERSGGRIGHRVPGMPPSLLLHTVGRRTGKARTSALTYARDGKGYLVTASNGGSSKPPAWLLNLTARPQCEVQIGTERMWATARPVPPDDEDHARLWQIVNRVNGDRYRTYQRKTDRPIPVVVLTPVG